MDTHELKEATMATHGVERALRKPTENSEILDTKRKTSTLLLTELKGELQRRGLDCKGVKSVLLQRLHDNLKEKLFK